MSRTTKVALLAGASALTLTGASFADNPTEDRISELEAQRRTLLERIQNLSQLVMFKRFSDLDWRPLVLAIQRLEQERRELEESSDTLRTLEQQLAASGGVRLHMC